MKGGRKGDMRVVLLAFQVFLGGIFFYASGELHVTSRRFIWILYKESHFLALCHLTPIFFYFVPSFSFS